MIDQELEALYKCTESLKDLDEAAKIRVLQYLINRFNLTPSQQSAIVSTGGEKYLPSQNNVVQGALNNGKTLSNEQFPSYREIAVKDYPNSETDWTLIYCFFASEFGVKDFTRDNIIEEYEKSKRWSIKTSKALTNCINSLIKKSYIKALNDNEYIIQDAGIKYVKDVLGGNSMTRTRKLKPKKKIKQDEKEEEQM